MKKKTGWSAIFLLISTTLLLSCNKYEDGPFMSLRSKDARITGEWEMTDIYFQEKNDGVYLDEGTWEDGMLTIVSEYDDETETETFKYEIEMDIQKDGIISWNRVLRDFEESQTGIWNWENNDIKKGGIDLPFLGLFKITRLTNDELVLSYEVLYDEQIVSTGEKEHEEFVLTYTFTKK